MTVLKFMDILNLNEGLFDKEPDSIHIQKTKTVKQIYQLFKTHNKLEVKIGKEWFIVNNTHHTIENKEYSFETKEKSTNKEFTFLFKEDEKLIVSYNAYFYGDSS